MYTISINGTQLTFDDQGLDNGPAILLLTGWGHDHRAYDEILPYLVPHHRVIRMDWRGHGLDRTPVADFGPARNNFQISSVCSMLSASGHSSQSHTPTPAGRHWNSPTGWAQRGYPQ